MHATQDEDDIGTDGVLKMVLAATDPAYTRVVQRCFALDERTAGRRLTIDDLEYLKKVILKP